MYSSRLKSFNFSLTEGQIELLHGIYPELLEALRPQISIVNTPVIDNKTVFETFGMLSFFRSKFEKNPNQKNINFPSGIFRLAKQLFSESKSETTQLEQGTEMEKSQNAYPNEGMTYEIPVNEQQMDEYQTSQTSYQNSIEGIQNEDNSYQFQFPSEQSEFENLVNAVEKMDKSSSLEAYQNLQGVEGDEFQIPNELSSEFVNPGELSYQNMEQNQKETLPDQMTTASSQVETVQMTSTPSTNIENVNPIDPTELLLINIASELDKFIINIANNILTNSHRVNNLIQPSLINSIFQYTEIENTVSQQELEKAQKKDSISLSQDRRKQSRPIMNEKSREAAHSLDSLLFNFGMQLERYLNQIAQNNHYSSIKNLIRIDICKNVISRIYNVAKNSSNSATTEIHNANLADLAKVNPAKAEELKTVLNSVEFKNKHLEKKRLFKYEVVLEILIEMRRRIIPLISETNRPPDLPGQIFTRERSYNVNKKVAASEQRANKKRQRKELNQNQAEPPKRPKISDIGRHPIGTENPPPTTFATLRQLNFLETSTSQQQETTQSQQPSTNPVQVDTNFGDFNLNLLDPSLLDPLLSSHFSFFSPTRDRSRSQSNEPDLLKNKSETPSETPKDSNKGPEI